MALWLFTTPTVEESPFAWNPLMERFRMPRGISIVEVAPCEYREMRYDAYTNEIGAVNLPPNPNAGYPDFWPAPAEGLHYFRGGYEHIVDDATKTCLINSGLVTEDNFKLAGQSRGFGHGPFGRTPFGH